MQLQSCFIIGYLTIAQMHLFFLEWSLTCGWRVSEIHFGTFLPSWCCSPWSASPDYHAPNFVMHIVVCLPDNLAVSFIMPNQRHAPNFCHTSQFHPLAPYHAYNNRSML